MNRRGFFTTLLGPLVARFLPKRRPEAVAYMEDGHLFYALSLEEHLRIASVEEMNSRLHRARLLADPYVPPPERVGDSIVVHPPLRFAPGAFALVYPPIGEPYIDAPRA